MNLCTIGTRSVVTVPPLATVTEVARLMDEQSVGSVVVVEGEVPVGIVTDRDLVIRVIQREMDPQVTTAKDVMSQPLKTIVESEADLAAATLMREAHIRRLPVLDAEGGKLVGIITLDDLTHHLSRCYAEMAEAITQFPVPHHGG